MLGVLLYRFSPFLPRGTPDHGSVGDGPTTAMCEFSTRS
jgi:hypothetical protein